MMLAAILALSVTASDAIYAVRGWVRQGGTLEAVGMPMEAVVQTTDAGNRFYAVRTTQGTVWTQSDTDFAPIIAFTPSDGDQTEMDRQGPAWALLTASVDGAMYDDGAMAKWKALWAKGEIRRILLSAGEGLVNVGDARVMPLTTSKWDQGSLKNGMKCYNRDTPGNSVCGCVATAMAQVLYCHKYPSAAPELSKKCWYNGNHNTYTTKGGVYDWDNMTDDPEEDASAAQCEAIGKLTYDCGVATHMQWGPSASLTFDIYCNAALCNEFGYESCAYAEFEGVESADNIGQTILCNLDAGYPVMLGIDEGGQNGHSIVGDGYGYNENTLYVHLNMGWNGEDSMWYALPKINAAINHYYFTNVLDAVYNIIPGSGIRGVLSGRVLCDGKPVANHGLTLCNGNGETVANLTTDTNGIYAFTGEAFEGYLVKSAVSEDYEECSLTVNLKLPDTRTETWSGAEETIPRFVSSSTKTGNSWGNELELTKRNLDQPVAVNVGEAVVNVPLRWFVDEGLITKTATVSEAAEIAETMAVNGVNTVAECYVIGISPTDEAARFMADIGFDETGELRIEPDPKREDRIYTTRYSPDLKEWSVWSGEEPKGAFFKLTVETGE